MYNVIRVLIVIGLGLWAAACSHFTPPADVAGECKVFDDPGFAVQGKRLKDKQWVGRTQEKGITVCHWTRPTS